MMTTNIAKPSTANLALPALTIEDVSERLWCPSSDKYGLYAA